MNEAGAVLDDQWGGTTSMPLCARGPPGDTPSLLPTPRVMEGCSLSGRLWAPALVPRSNTILCAVESSLFGN